MPAAMLCFVSHRNFFLINIVHNNPKDGVLTDIKKGLTKMQVLNLKLLVGNRCDAATFVLCC